MRRSEHFGARVLAVIGLTATLAYLVWRAAFSLAGTPLWLSLPTYLVEVVGFLGAGALAWALWPATDVAAVAAMAHVDTDTDNDIDVVDVVVRVEQQAIHEVRATLLAVRRVRHLSGIIVVDLSARPAVAALAAELRATYVAPGTEDRNGLRIARSTVRSAQFLLLDGGDIPSPDIVTRLVAELTDPRVAVAQGLGASFADDSAEHGPNGRHELVFERSALNPALGARGAAVWSGSGSLVRTEALHDLHLGNQGALSAQWSAGLELLATGWRVTAPGGAAVVAHREVHSEPLVADDRVQRARSARAGVFGAGGVLRSRAFSRTQRLAVLAWAVRPLSGVRRIVFVVVVAAAILSGSVPFHANAYVLVIAWLPGFVATSFGLALLSGWTLRPGDRARWSLHTIAAAFTSLRGEQPHRPARSPLLDPSRQYGAGLVAVVVALSIVLALRGLSDRVTHTLGEMPEAALMVLLLVTLWTLALCLDLLRVLARRTQMRSTARIVSSLAATFGERAVSIVDLTPLGAGLISRTGVDVDERTTLESSIPTTSGVTSVRIGCRVRNVTMLGGGDFRIGVEFGEPDHDTANALAEFCTIEPMWEHLGVLPGHSVAESRHTMYVGEPEAEPTSARLALRVLALIAVLGAVASSAPSSVAAAPSPTHRLTGVVVEAGGAGELSAGDPPIDTVVSDSMVDTDEPVPTTEMVQLESAVPATEPDGVGGVVVVGVCSLDAGPDGAWGTSDDTYDTPVATVTEADGSYQLDVVGEACWSLIAPPEQYAVVESDVAPAVPEPVDVSVAESTARTILLERVVPAVLVPADPGPPGLGDVSLTLFDDHGRHLASVSSDDAGAFHFDVSAVEPAAAADTTRVLPAPSAAQLAAPVEPGSTLSVVVIALAALLAVSILLGLGRPRTVRVG